MCKKKGAKNCIKVNLWPPANHTNSFHFRKLNWYIEMSCCRYFGYLACFAIRSWIVATFPNKTYYQSDKFLPRFLMSTSFLSSLQWLEIRRVIMLAIKDFLSYTYWQTLSYTKWLQCSVLKNSPKLCAQLMIKNLSTHVLYMKCRNTYRIIWHFLRI